MHRILVPDFHPGDKGIDGRAMCDEQGELLKLEPIAKFTLFITLALSPAMAGRHSHSDSPLVFLLSLFSHTGKASNEKDECECESECECDKAMRA
jgi:hypothetical protein